MKKTLLLLFAIFLAGATSVNAQAPIQTCNTALVETPRCIPKKFRVLAWVVKDSLGNTNIADTTILNEIIDVNETFKGNCFTFEICEFKYINNYQFDDWADTTDELQADVLYYEANQINVYFVETASRFGANVNGYGHPPGGPDRIVVTKGSMGTKNLAHQLGHFFGLYDTFNNSFGPELVDGSNSVVAGDSISDTPADPYPNGSFTGACEYYETAQDANGHYYQVPINNVMSEYGICRCRFTFEQFERMVENYLSQRVYLW